MKKGYLKQSFKKSARVLERTLMDNRLTGFFVRNSKHLSSWPFSLGYAAMILKAGMHPNFDTAAGVCMIAAGLSFSLQKRYPDLAFRLGGILGFASAACLSAQGFDFHTMHVADPTRFYPPMTGPMIANTIITFQKEIAGLSSKFSASQSKVLRSVAPVLRYPLLLAPSVDLINGPNLMRGAIHNQDWVFLGAIGVFGLGEFGVIASDQRLQEKYTKFQENKKPAAPASGPSAPPAL